MSESRTAWDCTLHAHHSRDLPDAGQAMCCEGAAAMGPGRCTCWVPEYDKPQSEHLQSGPLAARKRMCADCAFRSGSPERSSDTRMALAGEGEMDAQVASAAGFMCHDGMRKVLAWVHAPSGVRVVEDVDAYRPPKNHNHAWRADGRPALMCAGYMAARAKHMEVPRG